MKKKLLSIILLFCSFLLFGCNSTEQEATKQTDFDQEAQQGIREKAKEYSATELAEDAIPLNDYIKLTGEIIKTDSSDEQIEKGDRFILSDGKNQVQIFNEQAGQKFQIGDQVTVYGEYYGFVKGSLIERK